MFPSKFLQFPSILTHFHAANEKIQNGGRDLAISRGLVWVNMVVSAVRHDGLTNWRAKPSAEVVMIKFMGGMLFLTQAWVLLKWKFNISYLIKCWFPLLNFYPYLTGKQKFTLITDFSQLKLSQNENIELSRLPLFVGLAIRCYKNIPLSKRSIRTILKKCLWKPLTESWKLRVCPRWELTFK